MTNTHLTDAALARLALAGEPHRHLESCRDCAAALDELRVLVDRLRTLPDPPERLADAATEFFRRRRKLEDLLVRLAEEPALRAKAQARPEQVLREAGLEPVPELVEAIRDPGRTSGDLARRIAAKHFWL